MARTRDVVYHLAQFHVGIDSLEVTINDRVETHQRQHSMIGMMRYQLALFGQSEAIDAMWFEDANSQITRHCDNHLGHKEIIAAGNLGNEEDTRQWGMHDTRHDTCHTQ